MTLRTALETSRISACGYQRPRRLTPFGLVAHPPTLDEQAASSPFPAGTGIREIEHCPLPASAQSCRTARRFAGRTLDAWGVPQLADDLFLVVSELVANAVRHGVGLPDDPMDPEAFERAGRAPVADDVAAPATIQMTLLRDDRHLVCAVIDPSDAPPVVAEVEESREGGRGLRLVEAFSQVWGWAPMRPGGKMVWAAFSVPDRLGRRFH